MPRLLRATLRTAITWGAAWAAVGGALVAIVTLVAPDPGITSLVGRVGTAALAGAAWGVRFGLAGAAAGILFAAVVRLGYRGRRLADISPLRFGALGAIAGGVGVPLYLQAMNVLFGGGAIAWGLVLDDAPFSAVLGAAAAAGTILLARRGSTHTHDALPSAARTAAVGAGWGAARSGAHVLSEGTGLAIPTDRRTRSENDRIG